MSSILTLIESDEELRQLYLNNVTFHNIAHAYRAKELIEALTVAVKLLGRDNELLKSYGIVVEMREPMDNPFPETHVIVPKEKYERLVLAAREVVDNAKDCQKYIDQDDVNHMLMNELRFALCEMKEAPPCS